MTLQQTIMSLSIEQVTALQSHLVDAGLHKTGGEFNHNRYFKQLRRKTKGKLRRCYAAICLTDNETFERISTKLLEGI